MKPEPTKDPPSATTTSLRILHLEDNASDRELVRLALVHEDISCDFVYAASEAEFSAALDRGKIDLILSNFTMPGYDCLSALALATERVTIDETATGRHPEARPGEFIGLSVRDTGCGIPPEILPRIFEPFFTTKQAGPESGAHQQLCEWHGRRGVPAARRHGLYPQALPTPGTRAGGARCARRPCPPLMRRKANVITAAENNRVANQVRHTKAVNIAKLAAMFDQHKADLAGFLTHDSHGQTIPAYLGSLTESLAAEQTTLLAELMHLRRNVEHIITLELPLPAAGELV